MATTRRHIIELIQRQLSGGFPSADTELTTGLINQYLNSAVGFAVKQNYKEEIQLNGIESVNDGFYANFSGITIFKDPVTGLFQAVLPQQPAGVGAGWDISTFMIISGSGNKIFAKPISPREIEFLYKVPSGCKEVYYWVNGAQASLHSCQDISKYKANVRMISTQGGSLDSPMNIPDGYLPTIIDYISKTLGVMLNLPIDSAEEGRPTPQMR